MQDLLNFVMVALTQEQHLELCDRLYDEGKAIFEESLHTGKLRNNCLNSYPITVK